MRCSLISCQDVGRRHRNNKQKKNNLYFAFVDLENVFD